MRKINVTILLVCLLALCFAPLQAFAAFSGDKAGVSIGGTAYKIGSSATTWKAKLGKPIMKTMGSCNGISARSYTLSSKGIVVYTQYTASNNKEIIVRIELTKPDIPTLAGIKVGQTRAAMIALCGAAANSKTVTYSAGGKKLVVTLNGTDKTSKITKIVIF